MKLTATWGAAGLVFAASLLFGWGTADPDIPRWAALHVFAALAVVYALTWGVSLPKQTLWGIGLFTWAALSLLWSDDWRGGVIELVNGFGLLCVFLAVSCANREALEKVIPWAAVGLALTALYLQYEYPGIFGGFGNENFQVEFFLVLLPFLALWRGKIHASLAVVCAFTLAWFVFVTPSNLKWLMAGGVILAASASLANRKFIYAALFAPLIAVNAAFFFGITGQEMFKSLFARAELAINTLAMWLASPVWGHGLGSFNIQYPTFQETHLSLFPWMGTVFGANMAFFAGAAHNEYAQLLADYGIVGFGIAAGLGWVLYRVETRDLFDIAAKAVLWIAALLSLVEFPLQNPHTGVLIAVAAGLVVNGREAIRIPRLAPIFAIPAVAGSLWVSVLTYQAYMRFAVTESVMMQNAKAGMLANFAAYKTFSWPAHIRRQLATSLNVALVQSPEFIQIEPTAADEIFKVATHAGGRSTVIEVGRIEYLANSGRWIDSKDEIEERLAWLRSHAANHGVTWLIEGKWALLHGDGKRAAYAAMMAESMPNQLPGYRDQLNQIIAAIR